MPQLDYAALLRGVSPMNAKMPELQRCFESAGFGRVRTVLGSGNVVFSAARKPVRKLESEAEAAMQRELGRSFLTIVRPMERLEELLEDDPYAAFRLPASAKRVVTFLRRPLETKPELPIALAGARILALAGSEVFSVYVPGPKGPAFMSLIEKTFGKDVTTRTWDSVVKIVRARLRG
jgi:uncharacterized protein (DUF1697 family)